MAAVYKARDRSTGSTVALKMMDQSTGLDPYVSRHFEMEGRILTKLRHRNIVQGYAIFELDGFVFIALEFVDGNSLTNVLQKSDRLPIQRALSVFQQMLSALDYAHREGVIHRDIKPDNILLTKEGVVKLTDFGIAKFAGAEKATTQGLRVGTQLYMSPEQLRGDRINDQTDIWSSGVVMYQMLCNQLPFRGEHPVAQAYSITNENPQSLQPRRPETPLWLEQVILKCIDRDRSRRYSSAGEVLQAIAGSPPV